MFSRIRSLIFKFDPETAHTLAIKALKLNYVPNFSSNLENENLLNCELFGKKINNPIGIAAGFDKDAEVYNSLFKLNFGFVEVGTVTPLGQYGNEKPRMFRLEEDGALINRLGFNNQGSKNVRSRILKNTPSGILGVNIGPNKETHDRLNDYLIGLKSFHDIADYLTINISSPNTENLRNFHNKEKLDELLKAIELEKKKLKSNIPLAVKISPDINDFQIDTVSEIVSQNNIKALIVSNTTDSNRSNLKDINKHQKGGLSGKPLELISNLLINKFYKLLNGKVKIIGVGGIDSGKSVYDKLKAGAEFVQLYTGMIYEGPNIVNKIKKDLIELLKADNVKSYTEIIGTKKN